jgi:NAD-dependent DNA ligase
MEKIVCMSHPKYDGKDNLDLRCKACCTIFVNYIKYLNSKRALDVATWLEGKCTARQKTGSN